MQKQDFLSKINKKDYNNMLEMILEKKEFTADAKNLLLGMLYKVEISYYDYHNVKRETKEKGELIEEILNIIEKKCEKIELIQPKSISSKVLEDVNTDVLIQPSTIIAYPTEKALLKGLFLLENIEFYITDKYRVVRSPLLTVLKKGDLLDKIETIYDFDGWTWNTTIEKKEEIFYHLLYQNMVILIGYQLFHNWGQNENRGIDYINEAKKKMEEEYGEENTIGIFNCFYKILLNLLVKEHPKQALEFLKEKKIVQSELEYRKDKSVFLEDVSIKKKELTNKIKQINNMMIDKELLVKEYKRRNELLPLEQSIFSIKKLKEILEQEKQELMLNLRECNNMLQPENYIKREDELLRKLEELKDLNMKQLREEDNGKNVIELQKYFMKALQHKIEITESKKFIIDMIYIFRYYKYLKILPNQCIKDTEELKEAIHNLELALIVKACSLNVLIRFNKSLVQNGMIISTILDTKIIDLEEIEVLFKVVDNRIQMAIYDGEILDRTVTFDKEIKVINIKSNKKVKLFS